MPQMRSVASGSSQLQGAVLHVPLTRCLSSSSLVQLTRCCRGVHSPRFRSWLIRAAGEQRGRESATRSAAVRALGRRACKERWKVAPRRSIERRAGNPIDQPARKAVEQLDYESAREAPRPHARRTLESGLLRTLRLHARAKISRTARRQSSQARPRLHDTRCKTSEWRQGSAWPRTFALTSGRLCCLCQARCQSVLSATMLVRTSCDGLVVDVGWLLR